MGNNMLTRSPLGPAAIRNSTAAPFFRSMPPPPPPHQPFAPAALPSALVNRPPMNMSGPPAMYPNNNPVFLAPHSQMPFSGPPHPMRAAPPPPSPSQHMNGPLFPPAVPNHPPFQPASMTPLHMPPPDAGHQRPPAGFGSGSGPGPGPPQMVPSHCPPPFRHFAPAQQMQGPPRLAPVYAPRMPLQPSTPPSFANSNATSAHSAAFPSHGVNSVALAASNLPSPAYQQPPPPGVHSNQHLPQPPFYQSAVTEVMYPLLVFCYSLSNTSWRSPFRRTVFSCARIPYEYEYIGRHYPYYNYECEHNVARSLQVHNLPSAKHVDENVLRTRTVHTSKSFQFGREKLEKLISHSFQIMLGSGLPNRNKPTYL